MKVGIQWQCVLLTSRAAVLGQVLESELNRVGQERVEAFMQDIGGDKSLLDTVLKSWLKVRLKC